MQKTKKKVALRASSPSKKEIVHPNHSQLGLERIAFFSDAVIAIAMTLLVIEIKIPEIHLTADSATAMVISQLVAHLHELFPRFIGFFISFCVISVYWFSHHRLFIRLKQYDGKLIILNLLFLFFITLTPFVSGLMGQYGGLRLSIVVYASNMAAMGLSLSMLYWYALHRYRLVDPDLDPLARRGMMARTLVSPLCFLLSIPAAFLLLPPIWATLFWYAPFFLLGIVTRLAGRQIK